MKNGKTVITALTMAALIVLSGCTAMTTAIKKRNLEVKTQMSQTVWLDPVGTSERTVYLQIKNTTDHSLDITRALEEKLASKGYLVLGDPERAHYWLQANILKLDKMNLNDANLFLQFGYGGALRGAAAGALAAAAANANARQTARGGLVGGMVGFLADNLVEDVNYSMITDVQIVEKTARDSTAADSAVKRYRTRIVSNANKVNLDFDEARPALAKGLVTSLSGIF